ncbi:isoprenylcysteine carboxylmethyltransferase family protein [Mesorhizobium sp. WSM4313]|uniref:methyltransferase family protein n=1 Tax=Mesorhizobium sp. WSM4313 TaxID=2029412 RepID=UPI00269529C9
MASPKSTPDAFDQHKRLIVVQLAAVLAVILLLFSKPALAEGSDGHEVVETIGFAMVLICFLGRLWSILFVGGRKNDELIVSGPFSMTRNPLYFFSTVGTAGIGLMFGSLLAAALLGLASFLVFRFTARKEAEYLAGKFGAAYAAYAERTPSFWPNPLLYRDEAQWLFSTGAAEHVPRRALFPGFVSGDRGGRVFAPQRRPADALYRLLVPSRSSF